MPARKKTSASEILFSNATKAELLLKQLANARRLTLLCSLGGGEKTVTELVALVGLSHSALSQHLSKLKAAGLVECDKRGQMVYYRISSPEAQAILSVLYVMYCKSH